MSYPSFLSEHGASVVTDPAGNVFVIGGTAGDSSDVLVLKFDAGGNLQWQRTWDGPAWAPYSQDHGREILIDPNGDPLVMVRGVWNSNHPDYVVLEYDSASGATLWEANWGVNGGDFPRDMELDLQGDVYVTGTGIDFIGKFSNIKLRGSDGVLLWQEYDAVWNDHSANALALDGIGGVYVAGSADPEGDHSNFNDDIYVVKRDAATGALAWTFLYGQPCVGCYDVPSDVLVDSQGHVFVGGKTSSAPYSGDMITFALDALTGLELDRGVISGGPGQNASSGVLALDAAENLYNAGSTSNSTTSAKEISVVTYPTLQAAWETYCMTAPNSLGSGAVIGAAGSPSVSANSFVLSTQSAAAGQFGVFFYGASQTLFPFGDGWRCVGDPIFRLGPPQTTDSTGFASRPVDFSVPPANSGSGAILGGSTHSFQFWYRDPAFGSDHFNLSDGLQVDFLP